MSINSSQQSFWQHDTRRPLSFAPAIVLAIVGLMMGVAATFIIAHFAAVHA